MAGRREEGNTEMSSRKQRNDDWMKTKEIGIARIRKGNNKSNAKERSKIKSLNKYSKVDEQENGIAQLHRNI